jgi:hypothetical protein
LHAGGALVVLVAGEPLSGSWVMVNPARPAAVAYMAVSGDVSSLHNITVHIH